MQSTTYASIEDEDNFGLRFNGSKLLVQAMVGFEIPKVLHVKLAVPPVVAFTLCGQGTDELRNIGAAEMNAQS